MQVLRVGNPIQRSIVIHAIFIALLFFVAGRERLAIQTSEKRVTWIDLNSIPSAVAPLAKSQSQIVETDSVESSDRDQPESYLGAKTQTVEQQTVALGQSRESRKKGDIAKAVKKVMPLSNLGINLEKRSALQEAREAGEKGDQEFSARTREFVKGVREGEQTLLNTKEFVFFGYFQRIRDRLNLAWEPILRAKIEEVYRAGRQIASDTEHATQVFVILNHGGDVVNVLVVSESGTRQLDDAAVQAFQRAGPFPHPPNGLLDQDGNVRIHWEFVLKT